MKLRLVIIDDEVFVRKGIMSSIDWDHYGIEVVGEAQDGKSALDLIRQTRPHIVLTDIRMPHLDGLEMIRCIRQELPETQIFILSVLDDFQTVREALRLGVVDYVPKLSMTPDELLQSVLKAKERIDASTPVNDEESEAEQPDLNEQELDAWLSGQSSRVYDAWIEEDTVYRIAKVRMGGLQGTPAWRTEGLAQLKKLLAQLPEPLRQSRAWCAEEPCFWLLIPDAEVQLPLAHSPEAVTIGLSEPMRGRSRRTEASEQAANALGMRFYYGNGGFYCWPDCKPDKGTEDAQNFMPKEALVRYFAELDTDISKLPETVLLQLFPEKVSARLPKATIRNEVYQWVSSVSLYLKERGGNLMSAMGGVSPFEEIAKLETYSEIRDWCSRLHAVAKSMLSTLRSAQRSEIANAIQYIQTHYMLPMRLKDIAQSVHLSENYFSYIFTKETGKTFSHFLQEIRVEHAKRMLKEGAMPDWIAVGEKAGFESPKYFTKVFKKFTGVTPKQYFRGRSQEGIPQ